MGQIDPNRLLLTVNSKLASEWDHERNSLNLETIYANSGKPAYWCCSVCDYRWDAIIASRNAGRGCPDCAGKVVNKENSLMARFPLIAEELDTDRNGFGPHEITARSSRSVWWRCKVDSTHAWRTSPYNRTKTVLPGTGCPDCSPSPRTSKVENQLRELLRSEFESISAFSTRHVETPSKLEEVDIHGRYAGVLVAIEYDSYYWHSGAGTKRDFVYHSTRDTVKSCNLLEAGYFVVRVREVTPNGTLEFLDLSAKNFAQIAWTKDNELSQLRDLILQILKEQNTNDS